MQDKKVVAAAAAATTEGSPTITQLVAILAAAKTFIEICGGQEAAIKILEGMHVTISTRPTK